MPLMTSAKQQRLILIGGGCRSGKSRFALHLARQAGPRRVFLATGQAFDDEMRSRIDAHRSSRGNDFTTIEEPLAVPEVVRNLAYDVLVLDCLTLWLSNLLLAGHSVDDIAMCVDDLVAGIHEGTGTAIVVTNEVGMGIVPETKLGRVFRDVAGAAHQRLSQAADEVHFAVLGTLLRIKPTLASMGDGS
jgi:adenosylcobinamide kinase / adenosylcobinamide-phosphate guanylyltransferase